MVESGFEDIVRISKGYETPVIVFADSGYVEVLKNWLRHFSQVAKNKVIVIALDDDVAGQIQEFEAQCVTLPWDGSLATLWVSRARIFSALAAAGVDFVHSDIDGIWRQDPIPYCRSFSADIAFSPGTIWPPDVVQEWGFVVCCGFFFVRATSAASAFFQKVAEGLQDEPDDQVVVNRILRNDRVKWQYGSVPFNRDQHAGYQYRVYSEAIEGRGDTCSVVLLPAPYFPRKPQHAANPMVAHYLSEKSGSGKKAELVRNNLWWGSMNDPCKEAEDSVAQGAGGGAWTREVHERLYGKNVNVGLGEFMARDLSPRDFLEFGCGLGGLAQWIGKSISLTESYCIEPEVSVEFDSDTGIELVNCDILKETVPKALHRKFDLVFSIEVLEHIPLAQHGKVFDFLVERSRKWIVFSAARPGQGGHGHVSERPEVEWRNEFVRRGCQFDAELTERARNMSDERNINHRRNVQVFRAPDHSICNRNSR